MSDPHHAVLQFLEPYLEDHEVHIINRIGETEISDAIIQYVTKRDGLILAERLNKIFTAKGIQDVRAECRLVSYLPEDLDS